MSTNDPQPDNDSGNARNDPTRDCPIDRLRTVELGCSRLLKRAVTETTTVRASDVAAVTSLTSRQASYALRGLANGDAETLADRGIEPAIDITREVATHRYQRYTISEAEP